MNTGTTKNPDECNDKNKDITDNTKTLTGNPDECTYEKLDENTEIKIEILEILTEKLDEGTDKIIDTKLKFQFESG